MKHPETKPEALFIYGEGLEEKTVQEYQKLVGYLSELGLRVVALDSEEATEIIKKNKAEEEPQNEHLPSEQIVCVKEQELKIFGQAAGYEKPTIGEALRYIHHNAKYFPDNETAVANSRKLVGKNVLYYFDEATLATPDSRFKSMNFDNGIPHRPLRENNFWLPSLSDLDAELDASSVIDFAKNIDHFIDDSSCSRRTEIQELYMEFGKEMLAREIGREVVSSFESRQED